MPAYDEDTCSKTGKDYTMIKVGLKVVKLLRPKVDDVLEGVRKFVLLMDGDFFTNFAGFAGEEMEKPNSQSMHNAQLMADSNTRAICTSSQTNVCSTPEAFQHAPRLSSVI